MWFLTLSLTILIDSIVFGVPVLVYRFGIRKGEPIQSYKKALCIKHFNVLLASTKHQTTVKHNSLLFVKNYLLGV